MDPITFLLIFCLFTLAGVAFGILTGLVPGVHVNNIAILVVALSVPLSVGIQDMFGGTLQEAELLLLLVALIVGCLVTHTFLDVIPSIFLGAPDPDMALSVLPGHRMMLEGRGYEAIKCSALGSFGAVLLALLLLIPTRLIMGSPIHTYEKLYPFIPLILLIIVSLLLFNEKGERSVPKLAAGRKKMLTHLLITPTEIEVISLDEAQAECQADLSETTLSELLSHAISKENMSISLTGNLSRRATDEAFFLESGGQEVLVRGKICSGFSVGQSLMVTGNLKGRMPWTSALTQKAMALGLFLLAGFWGLILLGTPGLMTHNWYPIPSLSIDPSSAVMFPLFTGLFGLSGLFLSLADTPDIPEQKIEGAKIRMSWRRQARGIGSGTFAGGLVGWFPGVTSSSATVLALSLSGGGDGSESDSDAEVREFITSQSGVNTSNAIFNVVALFVILRARSGAMQAVQTILGPQVVPWEPAGNIPVVMALLLVAILVASFSGLGLTLFFGKVFARAASRIPYRKLVMSVIFFVLVLMLVLSGPLGLAIGIISTVIGFLPPLIGVARVHLMGCLMVPIMFYFTGLDQIVLRFMGLI